MLTVLTGAAIAGFAIAEAAHAQSPFLLEYTVQELDDGLYDYEFDLILENADGSWEPGQEFDWFVFGDAPPGQSSPLTNWQFDRDRTDPGFQVLAISAGGHNGPTMGYGTDARLPGYVPTQIGDTLEWAGTATSLVEDLTWSNLRFSPGATQTLFAAAQRVEVADDSPAIPEPTSAIALLLLGGVMAGRWRQTPATVADD